MDRFGLNENIIEDIINIIKQYEEITKAVIFGSRARGNYKKASDIDIALFGDKITHTINAKIYFQIDDLYMPYKIDLINFNTLSTNNKIRENILKEGIEIYAK